MPAHDLRDAFAQAAGPDVTVSAARLRYGAMNHQVIEVDGTVKGEPFALISDPVKPDVNPLEAARKMGVNFRNAHRGSAPAGTRDDPAQPASWDAFAALPSGAWIINPADGALFQKP